MRSIIFNSAALAAAAAVAFVAPGVAAAQPRSAAERAAANAAEVEYRAVTGRAQQAFGAGNFAEALRLTQEARALAAARLGSDHPLYFQSLNDIGVIHQLMGNHQAALPVALVAAGGLERVSGPEDRETLNALANLAQAHVQLGQHEQAEPLLRRVFAARERLHGIGHRATLNALLELAVFLNGRRRLAEIEPLLARGSEAARTALGEDSGPARDLGEALASARRGMAAAAAQPAG